MYQEPADPEQKYETPAAARYLGGIAPRTLEAWRVNGGGPRFIKVGRRVVYRRRDLDAWLTARERSSTSDPGVAARTMTPKYCDPGAVARAEAGNEIADGRCAPDTTSIRAICV
jgi:hypothetical protein